MIHTFRAKNYGCLLDVEASLTPLHAFIGPNDSGKSTLLHGLRTATQLATNQFTLDEGVWAPFDPFLPVRFPVIAGKQEDLEIALECGVDRGSYTYAVGKGFTEEVCLAAEASAARPMSLPVKGRSATELSKLFHLGLQEAISILS